MMKIPARPFFLFKCCFILFVFWHREVVVVYGCISCVTVYQYGFLLHLKYKYNHSKGALSTHNPLTSWSWSWPPDVWSWVSPLFWHFLLNSLSGHFLISCAFQKAASLTFYEMILVLNGILTDTEFNLKSKDRLYKFEILWNHFSFK
mgnify:CR=1 FL=1